MDKRRYVSRSPNCVKKPKGISADETGNAAADGYTVRHREPLRRHASNYSEDYAAASVMDENERMYSGDYPIGDY